MPVLARRKLILGASALALAGCGGEAGNVGMETTPDDMVLGAANAPATLLEYGSTMCSHCKDFHEAVWGALKSEYIDTGKVRFIFREILSPARPPIPVVVLAEFQLARCEGATPQQYFDRVSVLFEQQDEVYAAGAGGMEGIRAKLIDIGAAAGFSPEQVQACIADRAGSQRAERLNALFTRDGAKTPIPPEELGTPLFFLNGVFVPTAEISTVEGLRRAIDAAIAAAA